MPKPKSKAQLIDELNAIIDAKILKGQDYRLQAKLHKQLTAKPRATISKRNILNTNFYVRSI